MLKLLFGPIVPNLLKKETGSDLSQISSLIQPIIVNHSGVKRVFNIIFSESVEPAEGSILICDLGNGLAELCITNS